MSYNPPEVLFFDLVQPNKNKLMAVNWSTQIVAIKRFKHAAANPICSEIFLLEGGIVELEPEDPAISNLTTAMTSSRFGCKMQGILVAGNKTKKDLTIEEEVYVNKQKIDAIYCECVKDIWQISLAYVQTKRVRVLDGKKKESRILAIPRALCFHYPDEKTAVEDWNNFIC